MTRRLLPTLSALVLWTAPLHAQMSENDDTQVISAPAALEPDAQQPDLARAAELIVEQTDSFRKEQELETLTLNEQLKATAQYFADYMADTDRYGHQADGKTPAQRASEQGYDYCLVAENIAYQFSSAGFATENLVSRFVEGWKESPGHRKNMLDAAVTEIGVAVARSESSGHFYAVQLFGRPKSEQIRFSVENSSTEDVQYLVGDETFDLPPRYTRTHMQCRPSELVLVKEDGSEAEPIEIVSGAAYVIAPTGILRRSDEDAVAP